MEEDLTCAICLEIFEDPHILRCGHTFCLPCIDQMLENYSADCPLCRETIHSQHGLIKNFPLCNIVDRLRTERSLDAPEPMDYEEQGDV